MCHPLRTLHTCGHTTPLGTQHCTFHARLQVLQKKDKYGLNVNGRALLKDGCDKDGERGQLVMERDGKPCNSCVANRAKHDVKIGLDKGMAERMDEERKRVEGVKRGWLSKELYTSDRARLGQFSG